MRVTNWVENSVLLSLWLTNKEWRSVIFEQNIYRKWLKDRTQQDLLRLSFTCKYCQVHKLHRMHPPCFQMLIMRMGDRGRIHLTFFRSTIWWYFSKAFYMDLSFHHGNYWTHTYFWGICPFLHHLPQICFRNKKNTRHWTSNQSRERTRKLLQQE